MLMDQRENSGTGSIISVGAGLDAAEHGAEGLAEKSLGNEAGAAAVLDEHLIECGCFTTGGADESGGVAFRAENDGSGLATVFFEGFIVILAGVFVNRFGELAGVCDIFERGNDLAGRREFDDIDGGDFHPEAQLCGKCARGFCGKGGEFPALGGE